MKNNKKKPGLIRRFAGYYRAHLPLFALDMFCALLISGVDVVYPLLSRKALDAYISPGAANLKPFLVIVGISIAMHILRAACSYIVTYYGHVALLSA